MQRFIDLVWPVGMLILLFVALEKGTRIVGTLTEDAYARPFITAEIPHHVIHRALELPTVILFVVLFIALAALVGGVVLLRRVPAVRRRTLRLADRWQDVEHGTALRAFIVFVAAIAAWGYATYDYNLYFDQGHYADRVLLIGLVLLLFWRPVFVFPFSILLVAIITQFDYPLRAYPWTHANFLLRILVLFGAALLLRGLTERRSMSTFLFVLCCLIATNYWWSGLGKLSINWISHPHLNLLLFGAYANSWLAFLDASTIVALAEFAAPVSRLLMVGTLVVECGALLLLWHRYTLIGFLCGFVGFHIGVFAFTGMFFWQWILVELGLLAFLLHNRRIEQIGIFTPAHFVLSLLLIGGCTWWVRPTNLTWYDTPLSYTYRMEGIGTSGTVYPLPTYLFAPYNDVFQLGIFMYLSPYPQLTRIWGVVPTDHALADSVLTLSSLEDVEALEADRAQTSFDSAATARFDAFVVRFVSTMNRYGPSASVLKAVQAPHHLWSFARQPPYRGEEPLRTVVVYQVTSLYDGQQFRDIRKRRVRSISIPPPDSMAAYTTPPSPAAR